MFHSYSATHSQSPTSHLEETDLPSLNAFSYPPRPKTPLLQLPTTSQLHTDRQALQLSQSPPQSPQDTDMGLFLMDDFIDITEPSVYSSMSPPQVHPFSPPATLIQQAGVGIDPKEIDPFLTKNPFAPPADHPDSHCIPRDAMQESSKPVKEYSSSTSSFHSSYSSSYAHANVTSLKIPSFQARVNSIKNEAMSPSDDESDSRLSNSTRPINIPHDQPHSKSRGDFPFSFSTSKTNANTLNTGEATQRSFKISTSRNNETTSPISPPTTHMPGTFSPSAHIEGTFACVCGKRYATLTALKNHAKLHTIRERNFICNVCKKAFLRKQDLKRHETTHLEDYHPYSCDNCGTTFTRSDALSRHLKARRCMD